MTLRITHALFDFDGTISLVREGWQPIMQRMMVDILMQTPRHESAGELERIVSEYIADLTGKQTMYQMIRLVEEIEKRGGAPLDPGEYKKEYINLLENHIAHRLRDLENGADPEQYLVPGSKAFLQALQERGVVLALASGTDEEFVRREAKLLGVLDFFDQVGGAQADFKSFSKRIAIERIMEKWGIDGGKLAVFGDGFVEIEEGKRAGAYAIGVASNESSRSGVDEWKKTRLLRAGADVIVSDFQDTNTIWALLQKSPSVA